MRKSVHSNLCGKPRVIGVVDVFIVAALIATSIIFIPFLRAHPRDTVEVYKIDDVIARYPLDEDRIFCVEGLKGTLEVEIKKKHVRVVSSPCPQKICLHIGWISKGYEQIICAPNLISISLKSDPEKETIDAVSR